MLRKCWIDMAIFAGFTLQDKQFCYRKSKSGVCPDDGNFCLSSLHWALIGPLPSPDIWPTNKKWERIVLLIISLNGKQLVLFSQSAVPWSASLTPILPVVPTNTDSQADFSPEWCTLIGPDCRDTVLSLVEPYSAGAKVYAITTHLKASKMPQTRGILLSLRCVVMALYLSGFHARTYKNLL